MRDSNNTKFFQLCLVLVITIVVSETFLFHRSTEAYAKESADQLIAVEHSSGISQVVLESAMGTPETMPVTTVAMKADATISTERIMNLITDEELDDAADKAQKAIKEEEERKKKEEAERKAKEEAERQAAAQKISQTTSKPATSGYVGQFKLTAYCSCSACCGWNTGITATGTQATVGRTIAANPATLPYGTVIYVEGLGTFTVEDTGHLGAYTLDVFHSSHQAALNFGIQYADVYIVG